MDPEIRRILPQRILDLLYKLPIQILDTIEEIRIRTLRPVEIVSTIAEGFLTSNGLLSPSPEKGILITESEAAKMLNLISNHSLYALDEELRRGYITLSKGHRVGITGKAVMENGSITHLKNITGFNIRIANEKIGAADHLIPYIWTGKEVANTLIISPPRSGKTTVLRDLTRTFSYGSVKFNIPGFRVGLVDERSEIAGSYLGIPQKDVGPRTDVLDGCPKAEGMMMLIRSMSPQILVVDEIGRMEDVHALLEAVNAGVSLITSAHGYSLEEIMRRPSFSSIMELGIFSRYIVLSRKKGPATLEGIFDGHRRALNGVLKG
jgi:stage III sporulation protein AA